MKALIFAAGLGTRLQNLTVSRPKALVEIAGAPLIKWLLDDLRTIGVTEVVVNIHHFADLLTSYLDQYQESTPGISIKTSDERQELLDTGGGLKKALSLFTPDGEPILIHNVDIFSNAPLKELYQKFDLQKSLLLVSNRNTSRYLLFDKDMHLVGWHNRKTGEIKTPYPNLDLSSCLEYAFSGIHIVSPTIQETMQKWPDKFSIIDFYLQECRNICIEGIVQQNLTLIDAGKPDTLLEAEEFVKTRSKLYI